FTIILSLLIFGFQFPHLFLASSPTPSPSSSSSLTSPLSLVKPSAVLSFDFLLQSLDSLIKPRQLLCFDFLLQFSPHCPSLVTSRNVTKMFYCLVWSVALPPVVALWLT